MRAVRVGNKKESEAFVGGSDGPSGVNSPFTAIPDVGKGSDNGDQTSIPKCGDVLKQYEFGSRFLNHSCQLKKESRPGGKNSSLLSSVTKVLTWEPP